MISGCTNDTTTDFQLTASGYYVETNVECVSVCNSYSPPGVFFYAFFLEKELCFCRNASLEQLNISNFNDPCVTSTCLRDNNGSDCFLSSYEVLPLSLGIVEWEINVTPNIKLVDKEVLIQTNILRGKPYFLFFSFMYFTFKSICLCVCIIMYLRLLSKQK